MSKTSTQNPHVKFRKFTQKFTGSDFHFRVWVVGCKNRKKLDLVKIFHYLVYLVMAIANPTELHWGRVWEQ